MRSVRVQLILDTLRAVRGAKDFRTESDKVGDSLAKTAREGEKAGRAIDDAGDDMADAARAAGKLDREIEQLTGSLREMAIAQALTGKDFSKQIREQETQVRRLTRNRKLFGDSGEDAAGNFAVRFVARLGPAIASGPGIAVAGSAIGVAMAPSIAAGIGAGIAGGVGAAGIGAGIALVAKDPLVQAAGKDVGTRFAAGVSAEAQTFRTPVLNALKQIDQAAARTVPKIGAIFRNSAPSVERLTGNLIRAGEAITDSLVTASSRSAGPLAALGDGVESIGKEFGHMIDTLSARSPEGVSAINDLSGAATNAVRATTALLDSAAKVKGWSDKVDDAIDKGRAWIEDNSWLSRTLKDVGVNLDLTADGYKKGSPAAELYRKGVIGINGSLNDYAHYQAQASTATHQFIMDTFKADPPVKALTITLNAAERAALGQRDALVALSNQLRAQADPAFALVEAQRNLKVAQDKAAEATKTHGRRSEEARAATRDLARAALDLQGKAGALSSTFSGRLSPQMVATFKAAGLTKGQIKDVAREFFNAKREGDRYAKKYQASATLVGGPAVSTKLKILGEMQAALRLGNKPASYYGNLNRALTGARFSGGGWTGPGERMQPAGIVHADEYVVSKPARRRLESAKPGALDYMNTTGRWPGYARGGYVWPYPVNAKRTHIPSVEDAMAAVPAGTGYRWMEAAVRAAFPGVRVISDYRPGARTLSGNVSYHALGRAVDYPPSRPLAEWINARYMGVTKELISPWNSLNILNGRRHTYTGAVYRQHSGSNAHVHWAKDGYGTRTSAGNTVTISAPITVTALPGQSPTQIARAVNRELGALVDYYTRTS